MELEVGNAADVALSVEFVLGNGGKKELVRFVLLYGL
jgi:hypothetical protein